MRNRLLAGLTAVLAFAAPLVSRAAPDASDPFRATDHRKLVVYRNVTLIDSAAGVARPGMAIVVEGQTIKSVIRDQEVAAQGLSNALVLDLEGLYVLPGLIESHAHLLAPDRSAGQALLRRNLYAGVTAVRDPADDLRGVADLARAAAAGEIPSPDIYFAALMAGPGLFENPRVNSLAEGMKPGSAPWAQAVTDKTDVRLAVAMAKGTGATAVKLYTDLSASLVRRITAEAHRQGLQVWTHAAILPATPKDAVLAGADSISHVCDIAYLVAKHPPRIIFERTPVPSDKFASGENPQVTALFAEMRRRGTVLDATGRVYVEADKDIRPGRQRICTADLAAKLTAQAYRQGVQISTGTDGFGQPKDELPPLFDELEFLAKRVGMPPDQVIRSATLVGAMAVGQSAAMGTIERGKLANMMVVSKNPLEDIHNLRSVVLTIKRGLRYPRSAY